MTKRFLTLLVGLMLATLPMFATQTPSEAEATAPETAVETAEAAPEGEVSDATERVLPEEIFNLWAPQPFQVAAGCHEECFEAFDDCADACGLNNPACKAVCSQERHSCLAACPIPC